MKNQATISNKKIAVVFFEREGIVTLTAQKGFGLFESRNGTGKSVGRPREGTLTRIGLRDKNRLGFIGLAASDETETGQRNK